MKKYICVHGHFYQPPRENAWLEKIEYQESAAPYHDWNERISAECYDPNGVSRILNEEDRIVDIVNNYAQMSFNFGPTLLHWMEEHRPVTYARILEADRLSVERFGGHGSAIAQVYNHVIMPLASRRDKETQVKWGMADFRHRFGREPEGMWLGETAVDTETLEVLAENGIRFTILAPRQAEAFRPLAGGEWAEGIDTRRPYLYKLPSGREINLFFYDGALSEAVAFKGVLNDGQSFAHSLLEGFDDREEAQLVHIATDGESYGHHHRHGDMALAYCLDYIVKGEEGELINYGRYLELYPPNHEVRIHENSSWSCVHGVERWRSDCGCNSGGYPEWNQKWRKPLREALDWLGGVLDEVYEKHMTPFHSDPWALRNLYIDLLVNHTDERLTQFLQTHFQPLGEEEQTRVLRLLEMQRQRLLMFTSCAWFFDEVTGIETVQVLQYACRAIQIVTGLSDRPVNARFMEKLSAMEPNHPEYENGAEVYAKLVEPAKLTLTKIGMHYAVSSLFAEDPEEISVFKYRTKSTHYRRIIQGSQRLVVGRTHVRSRVTLSEKKFSYIVLYLGQHHLLGKAFSRIPEKEYHNFVEEVVEAFRASNVSKVVELFQRYPEQRSFSFFDMFKDERIAMLKPLVEEGERSAAESYRKINNRNFNLLNVMRGSGLNPPRILVRNLEMVLNNELRALFYSDKSKIDISQLRRIVADIKQWGFNMDHEELEFVCAEKLNALIRSLGPLTTENEARVEELLDNVGKVLELLDRVGVNPELNVIQEVVFQYLENMPPEISDALKWRLVQFADYVNIAVKEIHLKGLPEEG